MHDWHLYNTFLASFFSFCGCNMQQMLFSAAVLPVLWTLFGTRHLQLCPTSNGARSGDLGGHSTGPWQSIHFQGRCQEIFWCCQASVVEYHHAGATSWHVSLWVTLREVEDCRRHDVVPITPRCQTSCVVPWNQYDATKYPNPHAKRPFHLVCYSRSQQGLSLFR